MCSQYFASISHSQMSLWTHVSCFPFIHGLHTHIDEVIRSYQTEAATSYPSTNGDIDIDTLVFQLQVPLSIKDYLILVRNIAFELTTYSIKTGKDITADFVLKSRMAMEQALTESHIDCIRFEEELRSDSKRRAEIQLQKEIWPTVSSQLKNIKNQVQEYCKNIERWSMLPGKLDLIRSGIINSLNNAHESLKADKDFMNKVAEIIGSFAADSSYDKMAQQLESMQGNFERNVSGFANMSQIVQDSLKPFFIKDSIPIHHHHAQIVNRDINIGNEVNSWLEAEVFPLLYEIDDILSFSENNRSMASINLINKLQALHERSKEEDQNWKPTEIEQSLGTYLDKLDQLTRELGEVDQLITKRVKHLDIQKLFDESTPFLPIEGTTLDLRHLQTKGNRYVEDLQKWWSLQVNKVQSQLFKSDKLNSYTTPECLQVIRSCYFDDSHSNTYANIFLTKGYIGDSFVVGRTSDRTKIENTITNWKKGYRGTVLVSGHRLSGRSLLLDQVANHHFPKQAIRLQTGHTYTITGRTFKCGPILGDELMNIAKHGTNEKLAVIIDNLEMWYENDTNNLISSARDLVKCLDTYGDKIFFLVSTTHWVTNLLHEKLRWKDAFQTQINTDTLSKNDALEAVMIRHGATHKTLQYEGEVANVQQIKNWVNYLYEKTQGNIGLMLHYWAMSIKDTPSGDVEFEQKHIPDLPELLEETNAPLLYSLIMFRHVNEYQLHQLLGDRFSTTYRQMVQRYLHIGLLDRRYTDKLAIEKCFVNGVARTLHDNQWINSKFED